MPRFATINLSDSGNSSNSANMSCVSSASEGGACGEGPANLSVGSGGQTYADRLRRKQASPGYRGCVNELIGSLTSRTVQRPDLDDSLDQKFQSFETSIKRQRELFDKERAALGEERSHREMLKGPLKGLLEHASAPQPAASEQERSVNRESEKSDNVVNMSEYVNKSGSVHGDDDAKCASDSETEDEKKNDRNNVEKDVQKDAEENELLGLEVD